MRWGKFYFDAIEFSDGAKNLGWLATCQARARKKKCGKKYFLTLEKINFENCIFFDFLKIHFFHRNFRKSQIPKISIQNFRISDFRKFR